MYVLGRMHGFQSAKRFTVDTSSQMASAAKPKRATEKAVKVAPKPAPKPQATGETEIPAIASRRPEILDDEPTAAPDAPVAPPLEIELPPPPADGENVEVRRAAVLIEDDDEETATETPAPDASGRPQVRTVPRAVPFNSGN
jgi:hypothetical protein